MPGWGLAPGLGPAGWGPGGWGLTIGGLPPMLGAAQDNESFDAMIASILNAYQPPVQSTSRAVVESLPRLKVQPAKEQPSTGASAAAASGAAGSAGDTAAAQGTGAGPSAPASAEARPAGYAACYAGEQCSVCHDKYTENEEVLELPCQHCYHEGCILPWLEQVRTRSICLLHTL